MSHLQVEHDSEERDGTQGRSSFKASLLACLLLLKTISSTEARKTTHASLWKDPRKIVYNCQRTHPGTLQSTPFASGFRQLLVQTDQTGSSSEVKGIMCNWLVCMAVWLCTMAKESILSPSGGDLDRSLGQVGFPSLLVGQNI